MLFVDYLHRFAVTIWPQVLCRHLDSGLGLGGEAEPPQDVADVADVVDVVDVALAPEDDGESDSGGYRIYTR